MKQNTREAFPRSWGQGPRIRSMTEDDLDACCAIERESFFDAWSRQALMEELENNRLSEGYVLENDGHICGFYFGWHIYGESSLNHLAVAKAARNQGYGRALLEHFLQRSCEQGSGEIFLEVAVNNAPARHLYESVGFSVLSVRKNYYTQSHEDAYVMRYCPAEKGDCCVSARH